MIRDVIDDVWKTNRSLVTDGYDEALFALEEYVDGQLTVHRIPTGTDVWTWTVPEKWRITDAYIAHDGERLVEFDHPLRVVTYSEPIDRTVSRNELFEHVHVDTESVINGEHIPKNPDALPYVFKFYDRDWGFCLRESELEVLDGREEFDVYIDAGFEAGELKIGEYTVEGALDETILLMGHLDHPAQVNDDLAGVAVGLELMNRLVGRDLTYTYTLLVVPETIGSIAFFSQNEQRIEDIEYGIYLEMLGTDGSHSLQQSYQGQTVIDRVAESVIADVDPDYDVGAFRTVIGNDEMVTNGPGMEVPTISVSRWPYDEYHTSNDDPSIVDEANLRESTALVERIVAVLEHNVTPIRQFKGPIFLSGHDLWERWGGHGEMREKVEYVSMCLEGDHTVLDIAERHDLPFWTVFEFVEDLHERGLVSTAEETLPVPDEFGIELDRPAGD